MSAPFVYQIAFDVKTELGSQWADGLQTVLKAHREANQKELEVYTTYVGDGERAYVRVPLESLGEMDAWVHTPDLVYKTLGDKQGADALARWAQSFKHWDSRILRLSKDGH
ncbi:hypothetical protein J2T09_003152 [Neorhizobium huautlense]|uniref:Uncharacterized protein n=1 Tax=Neorhizobium huautlense TaxID=67774 RepID=A0ABT9PWW8_9HYPH|nr:hypothetical protein [Neorhizobium huautlense]MDP9838384.1 hypothetical protein [Neorhizobium huautlense]